MDFFSLSYAVHYSHTSPPFSASSLAGKHHQATAASLILASNSSQDSAHNPNTNSAGLRRPATQKPLKTSTSQSSHLPENPLKKFRNFQKTSSPTNSPSHDTLSNKLWLSSKLSPPPPPPPPPLPPSPPLQEKLQITVVEDEDFEDSEENKKEVDFREKGKIFVGNLPLWIKKNQVAEFFRQFGPIKNVILIKGHDELERNMGFGFVIYSGHTAENAAMKAVEFDGVEFHGRVLTVKLDDGKRMKGKYAERARWVEGKEDDGEEYRSKWHEEREGLRGEFRKVLESQPENWQAVVRSFERIKKVNLGPFAYN